MGLQNPHLQTALLQFADTFAEHISVKEGWNSVLQETLKYKQFLSNLGVQGNAGGTGNQIAIDTTCGDEEIVLLLVRETMGNKLEVKCNDPELDWK